MSNDTYVAYKAFSLSIDHKVTTLISVVAQHPSEIFASLLPNRAKRRRVKVYPHRAIPYKVHVTKSLAVNKPEVPYFYTELFEYLSNDTVNKKSSPSAVLCV